VARSRRRRLPRPSTATKLRSAQVVEGLKALYPESRCALNYEGPLQLLVATILSAQCTDKRVNMITPALFAAYPDASAYANAKQKELEKYIQSTGFFRNKAKNIIACCKALVSKYQGNVPCDMESLVPLAGIGRKTANVILGNAFGVPGIPVDTHVGRLSQRMGLTRHTDPVKIERDLMALVPQEEWTMFAHRMIDHGRRICHARTPLCEQCGVANVCAKKGL